MSQTIPVDALLAAVHDAFYRGEACHCHTVPKLGHDELMCVLLGRGLVPPSPGLAGRAPSIQALHSQPYCLISYNVAYMLANKVRYLDELTGWTAADLLRLDRMSRHGVNQLRRALARFGLALKSETPAAFQPPAPEERQAPATARPAETPEEIRSNVFNAMTKLGSSVIKDGACMIRIGANVAAGRSQSAILRQYITRGKQVASDQVAAIAAPLLELEDAERAAEKAQVSLEAALARREAAAAAPAPALRPDPENVVRPAFVARA